MKAAKENGGDCEIDIFGASLSDNRFYKAKSDVLVDDSRRRLAEETAFAPSIADLLKSLNTAELLTH